MLEEPNEAAVPHEGPLLQDPRKRLPCGHSPPIRTRTLSQRDADGRFGGVLLLLLPPSVRDHCAEGEWTGTFQGDCSAGG